jgi:hypothetical protein
VPKTAKLLGRTGVGVRWTLRVGPNKGRTYTLVFNRTAYQMLGENWTGRLGLNGASGGEALVKLAVVNKAGQLPWARSTAFHPRPGATRAAGNPSYSRVTISLAG